MSTFGGFAVSFVSFDAFEGEEGSALLVAFPYSFTTLRALVFVDLGAAVATVGFASRFPEAGDILERVLTITEQLGYKKQSK
jgi:hypothetical protein